MTRRAHGEKNAITAAYKLAGLIYATLSKGEENADAGQEDFAERFRQRMLRNLTEGARELGMPIAPLISPPENTMADQLLEGHFLKGDFGLTT